MDKFALTFPVYVINLEHRVDRREKILKNLEVEPLVFINAVNGRDCEYDPLKCALRKGEVGCFLSHLKAFRQFISDMEDEIGMGDERGNGVVDENKYALILEDDVDLKLPEQLESIRKLLRDVPKPWDIVYLSCNNHLEDVEMKKKGRRWGRPPKRVLGSHSYFITVKFAKEMLEFYEKNGMMNEPFDLYMANREKFPMMVNWVSIKNICRPYCLSDSDTVRIK